MITLALPAEERRALARGLWLTLSGCSALPWLALAIWHYALGWLVVGIGSALVCAAVAFVRQDLVWRLYRAWNRRLAFPVGRLAARWVMAICFFLTFVAVGRAGSRLPVAIDSRSRSSWTPRESLSPRSYGAPFAATQPQRSRGWMATYFSWATQTRNLWSIGLLPFIALLKCLPDESERDSPRDIYTLF